MAFLAGAGGLGLSTRFLVPTGGAVVLAASLIFFITLGIGGARSAALPVQCIRVLPGDRVSIIRISISSMSVWQRCSSPSHSSSACFSSGSRCWAMAWMRSSSAMSLGIDSSVLR